MLNLTKFPFFIYYSIVPLSKNEQINRLIALLVHQRVTSQVVVAVLAELVVQAPPQRATSLVEIFLTVNLLM